MAVAKITNEVKLAIERKTAKTLPDQPTARGYSAETIRNTLYKWLSDRTNSLFAELDRIVDEINAQIDDITEGSTDITYDNSVSGLTAATIQAAIDELDSEIAAKANLEGGNAFKGNQAVNGTINAEGIVVVNASITSQLNKNNAKIVNLGNGSDSKDAVNKGQLDLKENLSNKVNEVVVSGTSDQYVSAAALYAKFLTKVDKAFTIAGLDMQSGSITLSALKTAIGEATTSANGLLSASDKTLIDVLRASYSDDDGNSLVDTIKEVLTAFEGYPESTDLMAYFATKVDKVEGKTLSENDLTDELKVQYDDAVVHANKTDGTNPHLTTYANLVDKPTTIEGLGITDVYTKPETYSQLEINALLDNLSAVKGLKSTLLTPAELSNGDTISTNLLTNNSAFVVFTATDTSTEEIDSDTVPVSTIITGKKFVFFDNQEIVFTIGETNSTFETSEDITLKINLLYLDSENVQAVGVEFDGSLTNYLLTQTNVQEAIEKLDNELNTIVGDIDDIEYGTTIVAKSTGDKNGNDIVATYETKADATTHKTRTTALENANLIKSITRTGDDLITLTFFDNTNTTVITLAQLKTFIGEATNALSGLMTAQHVTDLDTLMALFDADGDTVVNTIAEVLAIFEDYPEGVDLVSALSGKVNKNADIVGATKTKITYDAKGLVTSGADLEESDIPTLSASKITQTSTANFVTDTEKSTWNGKQNALTAGDGISISGNVISADGVITVEEWDTATKTLALSDANKLILCSYTANQTLTIPTNATVAFPIGTMITFLLTGTHKVTFTGESGVYIMNMDGLVELKTQYAMASLIKVFENNWQLVGALE